MTEVIDQSFLTEEEATRLVQTTQSILRYAKVPLWKVPIIASDLQNRMAKQMNSIELFTGVSDLITYLNQQACTTCVISSNTLANVRLALGEKNVSLMKGFECGVSLFGKASKIRGMLKKLRVPAHQAIYIGDETRDVRAAKQAGVAAGAVTWGVNTKACLLNEKPTFVFESLNEIAQLSEA